MSKIKLGDLMEEDLVEVKVLWSNRYGCPIFSLPNGELWVGLTGEYGGYFEKIDMTIAETAPRTPSET